MTPLANLREQHHGADTGGALRTEFDTLTGPGVSRTQAQAFIDWLRTQPTISRLLVPAFGNTEQFPWEIARLIVSHVDVDRDRTTWRALSSANRYFSSVFGDMFDHLCGLTRITPEFMSQGSWHHDGYFRSVFARIVTFQCHHCYRVSNGSGIVYSRDDVPRRVVASNGTVYELTPEGFTQFERALSHFRRALLRRSINA